MLFGCVTAQLSAIEFQLVTVDELDISPSCSVLAFNAWLLNRDARADGRSYFYFKCPPLQLGGISLFLFSP